MRRPLLLLPLALAGTLALACGGCAMSQEDRDFYVRGWLNPRDLDRPAPYRGPRPTPEEEAASTDGTRANPWATPAPAGGFHQ